MVAYLVYKHKKASSIHQQPKYHFFKISRNYHVFH